MSEQHEQGIADKKVYISPALVEYGSVVKLTQQGPNTGTDSASRQQGFRRHQ